jgi:hypothetical protein
MNMLLPVAVEEGSLKDGDSISKVGLNQNFFMSSLGFTKDVWDFDFTGRNYKLPILQGVGLEQDNITMPTYY